MFERDGIVDMEFGLSFTEESGVTEHDNPIADSVHEKVGAAITATPWLCVAYRTAHVTGENSDPYVYFPKQKVRIAVGAMAMTPVYFVASYGAAISAVSIYNTLLS